MSGRRPGCWYEQEGCEGQSSGVASIPARKEDQMAKDDEFADRLIALLESATSSVRSGDGLGAIMAVREAAGEATYFAYLKAHPDRAATEPPWSKLTREARERWIGRADANGAK